MPAVDGRLFGELVRRKREEFGLTQTDVARIVYNNEEMKSRVADVEKGRYNPNATTVADYRLALRIDEDELSTCRFGIVDDRTRELAKKVRLSEALLLRLAEQFGPKGDDQLSLEDFLLQKASEYRAFATSASKIFLSGHLSGDFDHVVTMLDKGEFEEATSRLIVMEDKALRQVQESAAEAIDVLELRARSALLMDQPKLAFEKYQLACSLYEAVSFLEGARARNRYEDHLYQHGLRYGGQGLILCAKLLKPNISDLSESSNLPEWVYSWNAYGLARLFQGEREVSSSGLSAINDARTYFRSVVSVTAGTDMTEQYADALMNQAITEHEIAKRSPKGCRVKWAMRSLDNHCEALKMRDRYINTSKWRLSINNLGNCLHLLGRLMEDLHSVRLHLWEAAKTYSAAIMITTAKDDPIEFGKLKRNFASTLLSIARLAKVAGPCLWAEHALAQVNGSLKLRTIEGEPYYRARSLALRSLVLEFLIRTKYAQYAPYIPEAISDMERAIEVFSRIGSAFHLEKYSTHHQRLKSL